jgi:hypothetical protein
MITACLQVLLAILFCACPTHLCFSAAPCHYELISGPDGLDLSRGNKKVLVTAPKGWEKRRYVGYAVGFGVPGQSGDPAISVLANHIGRRSSAKVTPRNSYMGVNLETDIRDMKEIGSFDAGVNGKLRIWQFRTYNRNYLLTLIVQPDNEGRTEVDICLSGEDADQIMAHKKRLKEVARSIRIVNR